MNTIVKPRVIGIVGATASGKTAVSLAVAERLRGEILCMDSMQIYRYMNIGTAKPTPDEIARAPHHLLDMIDPDHPFSVAEYVKCAHAAIQDVLLRGHVPILVGGAGLYLQGLSMPMDYGGLPSDANVRARLQQELDASSPQALHARLHAIDPETAARLHPNDTRRVIRALEIYELTGSPMSAHRNPTAEDAPYDFQLYAIDWPRPELHARINQRVDEMCALGLKEEAKALFERGLTPESQSMQGIGYKEWYPVFYGHALPEDAVETIKTNTRNYARRQLIWFRRDKRIQWIESAAISIAADVIINRYQED